jgi:hypothetical protein
MTPEDFRQSLAATEPPAGLTLALAGLWWDAKGDWARAHESAQQNESVEGSWVHAYPQSQGGNPRWALPDDIATSKLEKWASQEETRFIFSLTDALAFESVKCQLSRQRTRTPAKPEEHLSHPLKVGSLRDICRLREFPK